MLNFVSLQTNNVGNKTTLLVIKHCWLLKVKLAIFSGHLRIFQLVCNFIVCEIKYNFNMYSTFMTFVGVVTLAFKMFVDRAQKSPDSLMFVEKNRQTML